MLTECKELSEAAMDDGASVHEPVLLAESIELLRLAPGATVVDATVGPGGHARELLERVGPSGRVVGIDRDPAAITLARRRLASYGPRFQALHGRHEDLVALLHAAGIVIADAVLADLGVSSLQLDDPARGFAFRSDGPLDMRMDATSGGPTAGDLVASLDEESLRTLIRTWGEDRMAGRIARAIVQARSRTPIRTTSELARIVERAAGPAARRYRIHPATRTFQALRIAVNGEVRAIPEFVSAAVSLLRRGGRLAVISFHSLEDRAVKRAMHELAARCICPPGLPVCGCGRENIVRIVTARAVAPSSSEISANPRARSAKLRVAERL